MLARRPAGRRRRRRRRPRLPQMIRPTCWRRPSRRRSPIGADRRNFSRQASKKKRTAFRNRPRRGQAVPAGLRAGEGPRPGRDGRPGAGRPGRGNTDRRRRVAVAAGERSGPAARRRPGTHCLAEFFAPLLSSGVELSGFHGDARGEAVLARNVLDDSALGTRDSRGDILATGVICARFAMAIKCSA